MEVDVSKQDCNREGPHWHLCMHGERIGQISAGGSWTESPDVSSSIRREAEELTRYHSYEIEQTYLWNKENGAG